MGGEVISGVGYNQSSLKNIIKAVETRILVGITVGFRCFRILLY